MSSGGPEPCTAYAMPVPSADRQNRMSCTLLTRSVAMTGWYAAGAVSPPSPIVVIMPRRVR